MKIPNDLRQAVKFLDNLKNINIIKHTGIYTATYDRGMGKPIIVQAKDFESLITGLMMEVTSDKNYNW